MWAIVHFVDDNSVEVVPSIWINNDNCAWPKNNNAIHKLVKTCVKPNIVEFNYYRVRSLSNNIKSLLEAREKVQRAQFQSDVSDNNVEGVMIKRYSNKETIDLVKKTSEYPERSKTLNAKRKLSSTLSSTDIKSDLNMKTLVNTKLPRTKPATNMSKESDEKMSNISYSSSIEDYSSDKEYTPNYKRVKETSPTNSSVEVDFDLDDNVCINKGTSNDSNKKINDVITAATSVNDTPNFTADQQNICVSNSSATPSILTDQSVVRTIIGYLAYLKVEVMKISDTQQDILQSLHNSKNAVCEPWTSEMDYFVTSWPINSHEELNNLESKLATDQEFQKKVLIELVRTGGKCAKNMIQKMMKKVFADEVLKDFTYFGLRNKHNFSTLLINKKIFEAVKKSKFINLSEDEIIVIIGKWLTTSKARIKGKKPIATNSSHLEGSNSDSN